MHPFSSSIFVLLIASVYLDPVQTLLWHRPHHKRTTADDQIITLTCHLPGATGEIQWYLNLDAYGGHGDKIDTEGNNFIIYRDDDMNEYDTYKYTCCAGHRCASHVVTYDPPCARDNGFEHQWPSVAYTDPLNLTCKAEGYNVGYAIFRNGVEFDNFPVNAGMHNYGLYSCKGLRHNADGSWCYSETRTHYLPQDCGRLENNNNPKVFTVELRHRVTGERYCTGVLISDQWVLTAAHCVQGHKARQKHVDHKNHHFNIHVHAGTGGHKQIRSINGTRDIIVHDKHRSVHKHDLALLKLSKPVLFGSHVQPACLGRSNLFHDALRNSTRVTLATPHRGTQQLFMKDSCDSCTTNEHSLCASASASQRHATCSGDSGSPIVTQYQGQYYVAGLVSWGHGYCSKCSSFTRLDGYYDWLADKIEPTG